MTLYRVENLIVPIGLWYLPNQHQCHLVHDLDLSGRDLPMDYDEKIAVDKWKSAAESLDQLKFRFNLEDLNKLIPLNFKLYEIESDITMLNRTNFYEHPLFQEIGVTSRKELDINLLKGS